MREASSSPPTIACSTDGTFHRGTALWDPISLAGNPVGPVQVGEQTLFQEAGDGAGLYAVDLANGRLRWRNQLGVKVLAILDGTVYLQDRRRHLQIVDEMTGDVTTTLPLTGFQLVARNTTAPAIYAARHDGRIYCIRKADAPVLTVDDLTAP